MSAMITVEEALAWRQERLPAALLGGERGGRRIEGFDLGNSPREYVTDIVRGRETVDQPGEPGAGRPDLVRPPRECLPGQEARLSGDGRPAGKQPGARCVRFILGRFAARPGRAPNRLV